MQTDPTRWLRLEGLAVLVVSLFLYEEFGHGWLLFVVLFLVPDLSMVGYLRNPVVGAITYNAAHTYVGSVLLATAGVFADVPMLVAIGLIWTAHIGFDRALGYGLKLPSGFKETHLGRIERNPPVKREP